MPNEVITCDLMVIGTGLTGMAASLFAAQRQIDTVQVGLTSEIGFASGLMDLLGIHPVSEGRRVTDPWEGIERLRLDEPLHPYSKLPVSSIRKAMDGMLAFMSQSGYPYFADPHRNVEMVTPVGTLKPTYAVPHTMQHGLSLLAEESPCLLVDFEGLKGFSARQIAAGLTKRRPNLRTLRIPFPGFSGELYTEHVARALEVAENRSKLLDVLRPHISDARSIGLPAVLGIYRTLRIMEDLQQGLGIPVFEIPTMLPAITGLRLQEVFEQHLPALGLRLLWQQRILGVRRVNDGRWSFEVGRATPERTVISRAAVLCSGRFFGKGLHADRHDIRETIFDLPVVQPGDRALWHNKDLLHPQGHPINRAGLAVDERFRPVDASGRPVFANLWAAGSILAHQDWIRQKCGSGLAIATAYGAVEAIAGR